MAKNRNETRARDEDVRRSEAEALSRMRNVLPLDAAHNEGRFYGQIIRGRPLNATQRVGFFLIGFLFCFSAIFLVAAAFPKLANAVGLSAPSIPNGLTFFYIPFAMFSLLLGIVAIGKSLAAKPQGPHDQAR